MTKKKTSDISASVRQRLLNLIRETGDNPNFVWTRYATERFLYRLTKSKHSGDYILKGAMLFLVWTEKPYRPTADLDLIGQGEDSEEHLMAVFRSVCQVDVEPDGLVFDPDTVTVVPIREDQEYQGKRITLTGYLGKARIPIQVDVGFGDVVTPKAKKITYPTLLDYPAPRLRAYPRETVIAEKLQAMVMLGIANSRMKDFYDIFILGKDFEFNGPVLVKAVKATFKRRKTEIPAEIPIALTDEFGKDEAKAMQWQAFIRKNDLEGGTPKFLTVLANLRDFLLPLLEAGVGKADVPNEWSAGGPWIF